MDTLRALPREFRPDPAKPHLILVGLPGAGKSTLARRLSRRLRRPYLDFDAEIERLEGRTVQEIFAERGEPYFRERELELTRELARSGGMILSPGGGWCMIPGAMALLRPPGRMIYLRVGPAVAIQRLRHARRTRPLLQGADPLRKLEQLLSEREPTYLMADHVVDVEPLTSQQLVATVARLAEG